MQRCRADPFVLARDSTQRLLCPGDCSGKALCAAIDLYRLDQAQSDRTAQFGA
jgi:hypothetical protein